MSPSHPAQANPNLSTPARRNQRKAVSPPRRRSRLLTSLSFTLLVLAGLTAVPAPAIEPVLDPHPLSELAFEHPDLNIPSHFLPLSALPMARALALGESLTRLGADSGHGFLDPRGDTWGTLILRQPLIPGDGAGNTLEWNGGSARGPQLEAAARDAFLTYLAAHGADLRIDPAEVAHPRVTAHDAGSLVQINARRQLGGVEVRGSFLTAVISHGNLVLYGTRNWGRDDGLATSPAITAEEALAAVQSHAGSFTVTGTWRPAALEAVPLSQGANPLTVPIGQGYHHRLVWAVHPTFAGSNGSWEGLVDAHSGELLAFTDTNHYADPGRKVLGGVFPVANDGLPPDGVEQPGYAMPFADLETAAGPGHTDQGGNFSCVDGTVTTRLAGPYVRMNDNCGPISESSGSGDLDLGSSAGTDCAVPPGRSPGNTHASRTGFYEVNRIKEMARGHLPGNAWLAQQLTSNMNIDDDCNAFWNGSTINFYTSGGGCANTGEIAAVFDHEWGHGMDDNDANPDVSAPGEATADIYAFLRLNDSCIGRGFRPGRQCGGDGNPCLSCTGVREVDWAKHVSNEPHGIAWINTLTVLPGGGCIGSASVGRGPCGQGTHCEGHVPSESVWDLFTRDLQGYQGSAFDLDENSALEVTSRLHYLGAGPVGNWYNCAPAAGLGDGCNADGGYLNFLAADDDNGDLTDGTPHMSAIFAAFDRHEIACPSPAVQDSGCAGRPVTAPSVSATPLNRGALLQWSAVAGATEYWVYRTEGVKGCSMGKIRIARTTDLSHVDTGLVNGSEVYYGVLAVGSSESCLGPISACTAVTPAAGADLALDPAGTSLVMLSGDGDEFIDSCESGQVNLSVDNSGGIAQTNVRIVDARAPSHPGVTVTSSLPVTLAASLATCDSASGAVTFSAQGLTHGDTVVLEIDLTSDQLAPRVVTETLSFGNTESDFSFVASQSFGFEADLEGWTRIQGTFDRTSGASAEGSGSYLASSSLADDRCDQIRSPRVRLTATSTLSLFNQFVIEPENTAWYDRANVALREAGSGTRTAVDPDGGRLYNVSGANGACVTAGENGWGGAGPGWTESTWSPAALNPGGAFTGEIVQLDVAYGTDALGSFLGFWFDEVTLTDFEAVGPDQQSDACANTGNRAPVAVDDSEDTTPDTPVTVNVLANDGDPDGDPLTVAGVSQPASGTATDNGDGTVTYTPNGGFLGTDTFTYTLCDPEPLCDAAAVAVTVAEPANRPPEAVDDSAVTLENTQVTIDVLANDGDPDGDPLTVAGVSQPASGTAADHGDGTVTYTPAAGFRGTDAFSYTIEDGRGGADTAAVTVIVSGEGPPSCSVPGVQVISDPRGDTNALIDATDDPSLDLEAVFMAEPSFAPGQEKLVVTIEVDDLTLPHPSAAWRAYWTSPDGVSYFVALENCDATAGLQCAYGTFDGTLFSAQGQPEVCTTDAEGTITIAVDKGLVGIDDSRDGGAQLTGINGRTQVFLGALCSGLLGNADTTEPGSYEVYTNDACANRSPAALDDSATTHEDAAVTVDVLANDSDPDGDPLAVTAAGPASNGSVSDNGDGTVTYTPNPNFFGSDAFTYTADDGNGGTATATVSITVTEVNDAPQAVDDGASTEQDTEVTVEVLANDGDADGDPLTVAAAGPAGDGTVVVNAGGSITYTPDAGFFGSDSFVYTVDDGRGGTDSARVLVVVAEGDGGGSGTGRGRVHGAGFWHLAGDGGNGSGPAGKASFSFDVRGLSSGFEGKLKVNDKEAGAKIDARTITSLTAGSSPCNGLSPGPDSFELTARGSFNGIDGAEFFACGVDNGDPGKGDASSPPDRFYVECLSGCSYNTASGSPDDGIDGGNIHLHDPIPGASQASGSSRRRGEETALASVGAGLTLNGPRVLELDPPLLTSAVAGAPQLLTAVAHAPEGLVVAGLGATLSWIRGDGATGSRTATTDALGVAFFQITVLPGDTEYRVEIGELDSNRIEITGAGF